MILFEHTEVVGFEPAIRGMRNPMNSWRKSDSGMCRGGDSGIGCDNCSSFDDCTHAYDFSFQIGKKDHKLMESLNKAGTTHSKYRRMIVVYVDITAPLYWWKEFDTYKVGTVANSCSTMHKIAEKEFKMADFSCEHLYDFFNDLESAPHHYLSAFKLQMEATIEMLNEARYIYLHHNEFCVDTTSPLYNERLARFGKDDIWWQMIQLLPSSYNQKRTVMLNYEVLANIYETRRNHKLDEWRCFCEWIQYSLPYSELITGKEMGRDAKT